MSGVPYTLVRSTRRTISIVIKPNGEVEVRCPKRCSKREVEQFLVSKEDWLRKHLKAVAARPEPQILSAEERKALAKKAAEVLPEKVQHFGAEMGVSYGRITIRGQRTWWGSCSAKGNLNFNCLLALFPIEVIDSVVVHELCHRKHMNHSPQFYAEIEKVFPKYKKWHKWLNDNGGVYMVRVGK